MNGGDDSLVENLKFENVWPHGVSALTAQQLRSMSDEDFERLKHAVRARAERMGNSASFGKKVARALEIKRRPEPRLRYSVGHLTAKFQAGEILDALVPDRKKKWRPVTKRKKNLTIDCANFSFLDNPIEAYRALMQIASADCEAFHYRINFNDEHVTDIAPFLVFGVMREKMAHLSSGGLVKNQTKKVLEAVGLRAFMRMRPFTDVSLEDVWPLPLTQRRKSGSSNPSNLAMEPSTVEIRADEIARKVDQWLGELAPPSELTEHGVGRIVSIVSETLNNAERHGRVGGDGEWITAGFMARRRLLDEVGQPLVHICHLSFLNLGRPISETVFEGPAAEQIEKYQRLHRGVKLSPDTLATVFALQDGISRLRQGNGNPSGGTGLMDMVEFANEVGRCTLPGYGPKVAILSGSAYIRFDVPYSEGYGTSDDDRRLQWFNQMKTPREPPDPRYVMDLPQPFPGTLITMRFVLDGSLEESTDDDDNGPG